MNKLERVQTLRKITLATALFVGSWGIASCSGSSEPLARANSSVTTTGVESEAAETLPPQSTTTVIKDCGRLTNDADSLEERVNEAKPGAYPGFGTEMSDTYAVFVQAATAYDLAGEAEGCGLPDVAAAYRQDALVMSGTSEEVLRDFFECMNGVVGSIEVCVGSSAN